MLTHCLGYLVSKLRCCRVMVWVWVLCSELVHQGVTLTSINCFACVVLISTLFVKEMLVATLHGHRHKVTLISTQLAIAGLNLAPLLARAFQLTLDSCNQSLGSALFYIGLLEES